MVSSGITCYIVTPPAPYHPAHSYGVPSVCILLISTNKSFSNQNPLLLEAVPYTGDPPPLKYKSPPKKFFVQFFKSCIGRFLVRTPIPPPYSLPQTHVFKGLYGYSVIHIGYYPLYVNTSV